MLTKTKIALAAAFILGTASAVVAGDKDEEKGGGPVQTQQDIQKERQDVQRQIQRPQMPSEGIQTEGQGSGHDRGDKGDGGGAKGDTGGGGAKDR